MTLKVKKIRSNSYLNDIDGYAGEMGILNKNGHLAFELVGCKEEFYWAVAKWIGFRKHKLRDYVNDALSGPYVESDVDTRKMRVVIIYRDREARKTAAMRVLQVMEYLRKRLNLRTKTVVACSGGSGKTVLVELDRWFLRSPVSISAALTFIRGALFSTFDFDSLDSFIEEMVNLDSKAEMLAYEDYQENSLVYDDAAHFRMASDNGNLDEFLDKSLPCLRRRGFSDCAYFMNDMYGEYRQDGIVGYHSHGHYGRLNDTEIREMCGLDEEEDEEEYVQSNTLSWSY